MRWVPASLLFFAVDVVLWHPTTMLHPGSRVVGSSPSYDFQVMTWSLEWWPWAVLHGQDVLHTGLLWAPERLATTFITSIPALSLLAAPLTLVAGPLVSYNVLMMAAPVLAALAAFALCYELGGRWWPALVGGYLFGFSPYLLGQAMSQHLNLATVWPIPLVVLLAVRLVRGRISPVRHVVFTGWLLLVLLGSSLELFATAMLVASIVLAAGLVFSSNLRGGLVRLVVVGGVAVVVAVLVASPIVVLTLVSRHPPLPYTPESYATDVANLVVPTTLTIGGETLHAQRIADRFVGNVGEQGAYLGLPLIVVCIAAAVVEWRRAWLLVVGLVAALVLSFGPQLVVAGHFLVDIPFSLDRLPVFVMALPARLSCFVALAAACLATLLLARRSSVMVRVVAGVVVVGSLLPQIGPVATAAETDQARTAGTASFGWLTMNVPTSGLAAIEQIPAGSTVLVLPFARTAASYWQAATGMRIRYSASYTAFLPNELVASPIIEGLQANLAPPLAVERLRVYLEQTDTTVVVDAGRAGGWPRIVTLATGVAPQRIGASLVWRFSHARLGGLAGRTPTLAARPGLTALSAASGDAAAPVVAAAQGLVATAWLEWPPRARLAQVMATVRVAGVWQPPVALSASDQDPSDVAVRVSPRGAWVAVAWVEARRGASRVRVALTGRDGRWHAPVVIAVSTPASSPVVAVADTGAATVVWVQQDHARTVIRAAMITATSRGEAVQTISTGSHTADAPAIAVMGAATVVVWREQDPRRVMMLKATATGIGWSPPVTIAVSAPEPAETLLGVPGYGMPVIARAGSEGVIAWTHDGLEIDAVRVGADGSSGQMLVLDRASPRETNHTLHARSFDAAVGHSGPGDPIRTPVLTSTATGVLAAWTTTSFEATRLQTALVTPTMVIREPVTGPALRITPGTAHWTPPNPLPLLAADVAGRDRNQAQVLWRYTTGVWRIVQRAPSRDNETLVSNRTGLAVVWLLHDAGLRHRLVVEPILAGSSTAPARRGRRISPTPGRPVSGNLVGISYSTATTRARESRSRGVLAAC